MTTKRLVALVTEKSFLAEPREGSWYIKQILDEDAYITSAFAALDVMTERVAWDDPNANWRRFDAIVLRTPWQYAERYQDFQAWLGDPVVATRLINTPDVVAWNIDKHYLGELAANGLRIVPTRWFEARATPDFAAFHRPEDDEIVIKPAISAGARHTWRLDREGLAAKRNDIEALLRHESLMVQPFQKSITTDGELTCVVIGGRHTHAVRKLPKAGDFRVQDDFGGRVIAHTASSVEKAFAERAVALCPFEPAYARVDIVTDNTGELALMELELIEPELFFRFGPDAASTLAHHIALGFAAGF